MASTYTRCRLFLPARKDGLCPSVITVGRVGHARPCHARLDRTSTGRVPSSDAPLILLAKYSPPVHPLLGNNLYRVDYCVLLVCPILFIRPPDIPTFGSCFKIIRRSVLFGDARPRTVTKQDPSPLFPLVHRHQLGLEIKERGKLLQQTRHRGAIDQRRQIRLELDATFLS